MPTVRGAVLIPITGSAEEVASSSPEDAHTEQILDQLAEASDEQFTTLVGRLSQSEARRVALRYEADSLHEDAAECWEQADEPRRAATELRKAGLDAQADKMERWACRSAALRARFERGPFRAENI